MPLTFAWHCAVLVEVRLERLEHSVSPARAEGDYGYTKDRKEDAQDALTALIRHIVTLGGAGRARRPAEVSTAGHPRDEPGVTLRGSAPLGGNIGRRLPPPR